MGKGNFSGLRGSSRTDKGVHALRNCFQIDICRRNRSTDKNSPPFNSDVVQKAINFHLNSNDITITDVVMMSHNFDARRKAIGRSYVYRLLYGYSANSFQSLNVFERERLWVIESDLDIKLMRLACEILSGTHDFSAFRNMGCQSLSPVKTISDFRIVEDRPLLFDMNSLHSEMGVYDDASGNKHNSEKRRSGLIQIHITANSFLYKMVRNMVSVLVEVGKGRLSVDDVEKLLLSKDRGIYPPAPPYGLYLVNVHYPSDNTIT